MLREKSVTNPWDNKFNTTSICWMVITARHKIRAVFQTSPAELNPVLVQFNTVLSPFLRHELSFKPAGRNKTLKDVVLRKPQNSCDSAEHLWSGVMSGCKIKSSNDRLLFFYMSSGGSPNAGFYTSAWDFDVIYRWIIVIAIWPFMSPANWV